MPEEAPTERVYKDRARAAFLFENGTGNTLRSVAGTTWEAYNGVAELIDHGKTRRTDAQRLEHIWFGSGAGVKARAFEEDAGDGRSVAISHDPKPAATSLRGGGSTGTLSRMNSPTSPTRRQMFSILPAAVGCVGCCGAALCATQAAAPARAPRWTEKADMTWERIFQFGHASMIPTLKALAAQIGEQKFYEMLRQAGSEAATKSAAGRPAGKRDFATWVAGMKSPNALFNHALVVDIIEETATSIDTRVRQCRARVGAARHGAA